MKRCPNCKNTKFSVRSWGFQTYDSEMEDWGDIHIEGEHGKKPFFCMECKKEFDEKELLEEKDELSEIVKEKLKMINECKEKNGT